MEFPLALHAEAAQLAELEHPGQAHLRRQLLRPQRHKAALRRLPLPSAEQADAAVRALAAERPSPMRRKSAR